MDLDKNKLKPEPTPAPQTYASSLPGDQTPLHYNNKHGDFHVKQEEQSVVSPMENRPFLSQGQENGNHSGDNNEAARMHSHHTIGDWTVSEIFQHQDEKYADFLKEYRNTRSQQQSVFLDELRGFHAETHDTNPQGFLDRIMTCLMNLSPSSRSSDPGAIAMLEARLSGVEQHNNVLTNDYNELSQNYKEQTEELQKTKAKLCDSLRERSQQLQPLASLSLLDSSMTTDDTVVSKWFQLSYYIRNVARMLTHEPSIKELDAIVVERLRIVHHSYLKLLQDPDFREPLMQSYLWTVVHDKIFVGKEAVWGGTCLDSFKDIRSHLVARIEKDGTPRNNEPRKALVAQWLAQGSTMMGNLWERDDKSIASLSMAELELLRPFWSALPLGGDRTEVKVHNQLDRIFDCAIDIDKMMLCSKSIFYINWEDWDQKPRSSQRYNRDLMRSDFHEHDLSAKSRVQFFISPIVSKCGTADGRKHGTSMVLAKASVVCD